MSDVSSIEKKRKSLSAENGETPEADDTPFRKNNNRKNRKETLPPDGYVCNLCQETGHWIQQCPEKHKINRKKRQKTKDHTPVPGVDPSTSDIEEAQKYQKWVNAHEAPKCFCGNASRMSKVKKKNSTSRAAGKYFFFCATKKAENPCRFARLVEEVMKEQKRKDKRSKTREAAENDETTTDVPSTGNITEVDTEQQAD